jgi:hypothetical protein
MLQSPAHGAFPAARSQNQCQHDELVPPYMPHHVPILVQQGRRGEIVFMIFVMFSD